MLSPQKVFASNLIVDQNWNVDNSTEVEYGANGLVINQDQFFVQEGNLVLLQAYLKNTGDNQPFYFYLQGFNSEVLDCRTATNTPSGFGIHNSEIVLVELEFSGSECLISDPIPNLYRYLYISTNGLGTVLTVSGDNDYFGYPSIRLWDGVVPNNDTRMVSFEPIGLIASSSATTTGFSFYINGDEWNDTYCYTYSLVRDMAKVVSPIIYSPSGQCIGAVPSYNYFSTTTDLSVPGVHRWYVWVKKNRGGIGSWLIGGKLEVIASSSVFYVGSTSDPWFSRGQSINDRIEAILASTTANLGTVCNPLSGFDIGDCLVGIIYPGNQAMSDNLVILKTIPPWGYAFRFYDILADPGTTSLPVINIVVPQGIPGTGATLRLDLNHSIDQFLYATTGEFMNESATSSETLFDITNRYWSIVISLLVGVYMVGRIIPVIKKS